MDPAKNRCYQILKNYDRNERINHVLEGTEKLVIGTRKLTIDGSQEAYGVTNSDKRDEGDQRIIGNAH